MFLLVSLLKLIFFYPQLFGEYTFIDDTIFREKERIMKNMLGCTNNTVIILDIFIN